MNHLYRILFLTPTVLGGLLDRRACNADNCARAVTGTRFAASIQAQHTADCSSFMLATITPATPYEPSLFFLIHCLSNSSPS